MNTQKDSPLSLAGKVEDGNFGSEFLKTAPVRVVFTAAFPHRYWVGVFGGHEGAGREKDGGEGDEAEVEERAV